MDIQMPVTNGYESTRVIRASVHPPAQKISIIAMTANAFVEDIRDALAAGMEAHILKPHCAGTADAAIEEVPEKKQQLS